MSNDCLFCKIISGDIPSNKVYSDDHVYAFHDINPAAPTHVLVIPRKHLSAVNDRSEGMSRCWVRSWPRPTELWSS